jgi:hypothetical protein
MAVQVADMHSPTAVVVVLEQLRKLVWVVQRVTEMLVVEMPKDGQVPVVVVLVLQV